jgi:WD40 repeat protein
VGGNVTNVKPIPRYVFLSHTSELRRHPHNDSFVAAAVRAVLRAKDVVVDMEYFPARQERPAAYCRRQVQESNVYVGIVGFRYGSLVRDEPELSYVELEFDEAARAGLPRLMFLLDDSEVLPVPAADLFDFQYIERQRAFRARIEAAGGMARLVSSPAQLELGLFQALTELRQQPVRERRDRNAADAGMTALRAPANQQPDPAEQSRHWQHGLDQQHLRDEEMRRHFVPSIAGFLGRDRALTDICRWLNDLADFRPLVVTGAPGSGKTAVLGLLAALSDPRWRPTVSLDGLSAASILPPGIIDVTISASGRASDEVLAAFAAAVGMPDPGSSDFGSGVARLLASLAERDRPLVAVVDALDEAVDPAYLTEQLLRPLIEYGRGIIRLLLGTRRDFDVDPGQALMRFCREINLDVPPYADPESLAALVRRILGGGADPHARIPIADCPPAILEAAVSAIAESAGRSFLVARTVATTLASQPTLPDIGDPSWRASLPSQVGQAIRKDLETRLGGELGRGIDLMRPLAYAQGPGLPWEDIWPLLANALSPGHRYTGGDLVWLRDRVGSYFVESGTIAGRPLYAPYHRAVTDLLRAGRDERDDEHAIATALTRHVPHVAGGRRDWPAAHPYTLAYLPAHAARSEMIDDLAQDPGFLLECDPRRLLAGLESATGGAARSAARAYRRARPFLRRCSAAEGPAYLALAARWEHSDALAARVVADKFDTPWRPLWTSWRLQRPQEVIVGHAGRVRSVAVAELDGRPVVVSGGGDDGDNTVRIWDLATREPVGDPFRGHAGPVYAVAVAELDRRPVVVSGGGDNAVRVWDLATREPVGEPFTGHTDWVKAVAVAELDGRPVVVSGSDDKTVRVWELATGMPVGDPFRGHAGPVYAVAVPELDGRPVVVSGSDDKTVRVWELATGAPVGDPFRGHAGPVYAVAVPELDGRPVVVSGSDDKTVRVWELATGAPVGDPFSAHTDEVNAVAVTVLDDRPVVVSGGDDKTVRVWELATGALVGDPFCGHAGPVYAVAVTELDGRPVVVSGSDDQTVRVWEPASDSPVGVPFSAHTDEVNAVAVAELDGRPVVVSGSDDKTVRVWELASGSPVGVPFSRHTEKVNAVAVTVLDDRPVVVSGGGDKTARVWELATGVPVGDPFRGHAGPVYAVAVAELDGRPVVVSGGGDNAVRVWDLATREPVGEPFTGHTDWVKAVAVAELDGRPVVVSGGDDKTVRVWELASGSPVGVPFSVHTDEVNAVAVTVLDGRPVVVSGGDDHTLRVWDLATGSPVGDPFAGHTDWVKSVAVTVLDDRQVVVSGGGDNTVRVWDLATREPVGDPFTGHTDWVKAVAVAVLDGRPVVVSGSDDKTVRVWDLATGRVGDLLSGHTREVNAVATAELDGLVVSGSDDKTVRVWELATGLPVGDPFRGHRGPVYAVAVAELDGRPVVVSGGGDGTVRIWDLATGSPMSGPFAGHTDKVNAVAAAMLDGRPVVVSGSDDKTVRVWDLATGSPVGEPYRHALEMVTSLTLLAAATVGNAWMRARSVLAVVSAGDSVIVLAFSPVASPVTWTHVMTIHLGSYVLATAWLSPRTLIVAAENGITAIRLQA